MSENNDAIKLSWYAVHVATGFENKMIEEMTRKIASQGLESYFGELIVPTEEVVELKDGKKVSKIKKLMPGYILVEMNMHDDAWYLVRNATKVLGFLGGKKGQKPMPMPKVEVDHILNRAEGQDAPKPRMNVAYDVGEMVRVITGPFADFQGVVEDVNHEKSRLVVSVLIFGRSTPVDLEFGQVEKLT
ncbi:transcription termination/antitermination protein NusG [Gammaproteobacteria bacterium]|nr:transcription termination/antitermination protein NusG [Gammaproteobacteria bacterium]